MNSKIESLRLSNPEIAITVHWQHDPNYQWDGDGPDPEIDGYLPHDVEVRASKVVAGGIVTGSTYLGGCYAIPDDFDAEIDGYLDQMIDEALASLARVELTL